MIVPRNLTVAVVGATGAVGREFLEIFKSHNFPVGNLKLLASERSAGKHLNFKDEPVCIEVAGPESFEGVEVAFFSAGAARSRALIPAALKAGAICIDNSSAFRMDSDVPLVVPEINWSAVSPEHKLFPVANCTAIVLCMAVAPLRKLGKIERLIVSTYQSASGGGAAMMDELESQTRSVLAGKQAAPVVLKEPYAFNLFSHNTPINEFGYNEEEWKVIHETRKILEMADLKVNVTCVRVPVMRAHSESVTIEFGGEAPSLEAIRTALEGACGVKLMDDREGNRFPTPLEASGKEEVFVGRIRMDLSHPSAVSMFIAGDQLLKGAALNAVQIAEKLIEVGRL